MLELDSVIYVAGHRGMLGSAVVRELRSRGFERILTARRERLDLRDQKATFDFLKETQPDVVVMAAARVGGILANSSYPAEFLYDNLAMSANVIEGAFAAGTERLLYLGSACIYPRDADQPMREDALLSAPLEKSNEPYAIAKIAALKMCESYRNQYGVTFHSAMPTNLYGTGDNHHPDNSHVLPAMIRRFHEAKESGLEEVVIWGTGTPLREFLHTDDCARGLLFLLEMENPPHWVNVGSGVEISIRALAEMVAGIVGYTGSIVQDESKPDGTPRKLLDSSVLRGFGWKPEIDLEAGIELAYREFLAETVNGTIRES